MEKVLPNPLDSRRRASYAEKTAIDLIYQAYSQSVFARGTTVFWLDDVAISFILFIHRIPHPFSQPLIPILEDDFPELYK